MHSSISIILFVLFATSIEPDKLAQAANFSGEMKALLNAPYPPIDNPAINVSSCSELRLKKLFTSSGNSSFIKSQYAPPCSIFK